MLLIDNDGWVRLENHAPKRVQLYKLNLRDLARPMSRVRSLGEDDALFFGANCSYVVSTSSCADIRRNCIYFTDQVACLLS